MNIFGKITKQVLKWAAAVYVGYEARKELENSHHAEKLILPIPKPVPTFADIKNPIFDIPMDEIKMISTAEVGDIPNLMVILMLCVAALVLSTIATCVVKVYAAFKRSAQKKVLRSLSA